MVKPSNLCSIGWNRWNRCAGGYPLGEGYSLRSARGKLGEISLVIRRNHDASSPLSWSLSSRASSSGCKRLETGEG